MPARALPRAERCPFGRLDAVRPAGDALAADKPGRQDAAEQPDAQAVMAAVVVRQSAFRDVAEARRRQAAGPRGARSHRERPVSERAAGSDSQSAPAMQATASAGAGARGPDGAAAQAVPGRFADPRPAGESSAAQRGQSAWEPPDAAVSPSRRLPRPQPPQAVQPASVSVLPRRQVPREPAAVRPAPAVAPEWLRQLAVRSSAPVPVRPLVAVAAAPVEGRAPLRERPVEPRPLRRRAVSLI